MVSMVDDEVVDIILVFDGTVLLGSGNLDAVRSSRRSACWFGQLGAPRLLGAVISFSRLKRGLRERGKADSEKVSQLTKT
jgi:hypothetical protein